MKFKKMIGLVACTLVFNMMYGTFFVENVCAMDVASLYGLQNCPNLQTLGLQNCPNLQTLVLQNCPNLQTLDLSYTRVTSLHGLQNCPNLQTLHLFGSGVTSLAGTGLENLLNLRVVF